jgi:tetratricopeptide (TPR) repeat protein
MSVSQYSLREHLRRASEAVSRAASAFAVTTGGADFKATQLQQLQQKLLGTAREHLAVVRAAAIETYDVAGLPGLPSGRADDQNETPLAGQLALGAVWKNIAELERLRGDNDACMAAYRQALTIAPDDVTVHAQLADLLESRHNVASAKEHAERALQADPANAAAGLALARVLVRQQKFAAAERAASVVAEAPRATVEDRALAWSLIGEARDRRDDPSSAFGAFTEANLLMRRRYDEEWSHPAHPANVRILTQIVKRMRATPSRPQAAHGAQPPAFLIGFPRSGTTLLEQVLASHSKIMCLGETDYLFEAASVVLSEGDLFDRVSALTAAEIATVRDAYRQMVLKDCPSADGQLIVDKHPLHITLLPLINKIFPDAKIIFSQRDPRDVVLSCYQQCFALNVATAQFLELDRAADYFDAVMELMIACREKLNLDLLQVNYHDVVADLEREAWRTAAFLGVAFEPGMLRYDETARRRAIGSASARQVINPIYDRSIERWRRYARELAPVLPLLNKWARRLGYAE